MDFDEIMQKITQGLTGDSAQDIPYLKAQMEEYREHEMGKEIVRACSRLLVKMLPEDKKAELDNLFRNRELGIESALEEANFNIFKKKYDTALMIVERMVHTIEKEKLFADDSVSEFHAFREPFEAILYDYFTKPKRKLRRANEPYDEVYLTYGSLLFELKRYDEAAAALDKALRWNPVSASAMFERAEVFKVRGDMEGFFRQTKEALRFAFRTADVARCYRNIAFYFVEKKLLNEALGCLELSMLFDSSAPTAQSEMYYIQQLSKGTAAAPEMAVMERVAKKYGFSLGPSEELLQLCFSLGKYHYDRKEWEDARYFLSIVDALLNDAEVKKMIDRCGN